MSVGCAAEPEPAPARESAPVAQAEKAEKAEKAEPPGAPVERTFEIRTLRMYAWKERRLIFADGGVLTLDANAPREAERILLQARRGAVLRIFLKGGRVVHLQRVSLTPVQRILRRARVGDRLRLRVGKRGTRVLYKLVELKPNTLVLTPRAGDGWKGRVEIERRAITEVEILDAGS